MTDSKRLKDMIRKSGLKYTYLAQKLGISYFALKKKIENETEFKASEIQAICDLLAISDLSLKENIFFGN